MSGKANTLREKKRFKAVRRRNRIVKAHNFATKTLEKPEHIFFEMAEAVKEGIYKVIAINRMRKIERERKL